MHLKDMKRLFFKFLFLKKFQTTYILINSQTYIELTSKTIMAVSGCNDLFRNFIMNNVETIFVKKSAYS